VKWRSTPTASRWPPPPFSKPQNGRDLPARFGPWNSVWCRHGRWAASGVWGRGLAAVRDPAAETLILDSTVVQALGRSRGGFSTKEHVVVNGRRHPQHILLTPGPAGDAPQTAELLATARPHRRRHRPPPLTTATLSSTLSAVI